MTASGSDARSEGRSIEDLSLRDLGPVHFLGIGGVGVSAVARLYLAAGVEVSGTDAKDLPVLRELEAAGARTFVGFKPRHVEGAETIVMSSAIRDDNPELVEARERGLRVLHRSEGLALLMKGRSSVTVAGTHGKTTTSSMITTMLTKLGADPSFAVGATVGGLGTNAAAGGGDVFVAEADESDGSFLNYEPNIAVVTNIEPDHLDHYGTPEAVAEAFEKHVQRVPEDGAVVVCLDDAGAAELAQKVSAYGHGPRVVGYGFTPDADVRVSRMQPQGTGMTAKVTTRKGVAQLSLPFPGAHNVLNASAAIAVGVLLGFDPQECADALADFKGASRRFDFKGEARGVRVYDDYAHHPTEVTAALGAARDVAEEGRVHAVFQPHLFSRTRDFAHGFADAVSLADTVTLLPIYPAREDPIPGVTTQLIADHVGVEHALVDAEDVPARMAELARPGDVILTLGAGDVTALGPQIVDEIAEHGFDDAESGESYNG
ncbi:UDP-N-acetylmuramate--L-alanine ligase [Pseudoglutamicibacter cumminsii]|uniref:UDP-N-acetylmuramate--L-alanine ligase n=1 Tax=Pseudoglutamicibacter cumminsii TaxID=156979 RepID=UPI0019595333|nr:UDP-N-acetylmuramate--L-alanine ligase [Pseudoglutamicibacter cumminsii]MBM7795137.1 UDP-N-acetylmuramate--alanine ligase [Pseudoglutamicibacter cumminsii]